MYIIRLLDICFFRTVLNSCIIHSNHLLHIVCYVDLPAICYTNSFIRYRQVNTNSKYPRYYKITYNLFINSYITIRRRIEKYAYNEWNSFETPLRDTTIHITWLAGVHTLDAFDARVSSKGERKKKCRRVWGRRLRVDEDNFRIVLSHTRYH